MTRYLAEGGFNIAGTENGTTNDKYREGWERTFGKKNGPESEAIDQAQAECDHSVFVVTKHCAECDLVLSVTEFGPIEEVK